MKVSKSLIAAAVVVALPLSVLAGDKDKTPAPLGTVASAQFTTLDSNRDGRISQVEAARDSKIVFTSVDKNGDGFIDGTEFAHRDTANDAAMPNSGEPAADPAQPRQ
jgi:hypothetical protein